MSFIIKSEANKIGGIAGGNTDFVTKGYIDGNPDKFETITNSFYQHNNYFVDEADVKKKTTSGGTINGTLAGTISISFNVNHRPIDGEEYAIFKNGEQVFSQVVTESFNYTQGFACKTGDVFEIRTTNSYKHQVSAVSGVYSSGGYLGSRDYTFILVIGYNNGSANLTNQSWSITFKCDSTVSQD